MGAALDRGNRKAVTASVDALALPPGGAVADVGFGGGVGLALLLDRADPSTTVHGVEVSDEMLARAARRFSEPIATGRLRLHRASMTDLPFAPTSLDGVVTTNTIYFVEDLDRAFAGLAGALKPSGRARHRHAATRRRWRRCPSRPTAFASGPSKRSPTRSGGRDCP